MVKKYGVPFTREIAEVTFSDPSANPRGGPILGTSETCEVEMLISPLDLRILHVIESLTDKNNVREIPMIIK